MQGRLGGSAEKIAVSRGCELDWRIRHETPAVRMDPGLSGLLGEAVREAGKPVHRMPSGAGHDAAQMARLTPAALLFVRCEGGVSHNPAESVREEDVAEAIKVMIRFLTLMTATQTEETRERGAST